MTTPLEKELKREVDVRGQPFTLTVSPDGLKLVPKGKRNGVELRWLDLVTGDAALSAALNASLGRISEFPGPAPARAPSTSATGGGAGPRKSKKASVAARSGRKAAPKPAGRER
jgi:hypothetical protein